MSAEKEHYNVRDEFLAEAKPLWEQLFALAKKYNVPLVVGACVSNTDDAYESAGCMHMVGEARTPPAFSIATAYIHGGMQDGNQTAAHFNLREMFKRVGNLEENRPTAEPVEVPAKPGKLH